MIGFILGFLLCYLFIKQKEKESTLDVENRRILYKELSRIYYELKPYKPSFKVKLPIWLSMPAREFFNFDDVVDESKHHDIPNTKDIDLDDIGMGDRVN